MALSTISRTVRLNGHQLFRDGECLYTGDSATFLTDVYERLDLNYPKFYKMDRLSKAVFLGSEYLLQDFATDSIPDFKKGIILQNHSSSLDTDEKYQESLASIPSPSLFVYTLPNICMGEIAIRHHFKGENTFFITAEFDPNKLNQYVAILFKENFLDLAISGYAEVRNGKMDIQLRLEMRDVR